ncbi:MAG TPA: alpha/beta fold hydrolase [Longimicrobiales bacterium]
MPVLLVPGWSDRGARLEWLRRQFLRSGWSELRVRALDFRDRFGSNEEHSAEIEQAVSALRAQSGSAAVDIVAHSMGGLAVRHYLHVHGGARVVRRVVFTGTPHQGTWAAYLAWGGGARDMRPGSPFLAKLRTLPPVPAGVGALCIHTPLDTRILPQRSAQLPDVRCQRVWCASHPRLLRSRKVFAAIRAFLEE